ncbi:MULTISPECIES: bacteriocin [unclassified Legionella]|uniref:bacteriocin n=1 Tax=unclassified Legionella TaxID=2622702 RepID=UPI0010552280|nr:MULTISPECIES: bacteriocin [unclassified Legionella]MDI9818511.1 bacteriocin [Legionella sp. PL877]
MENKERVLGYCASKELTNEELTEVSGGSAKMTTRTTQRATGSYPGNVDGVVDQVVDW